MGGRLSLLPPLRPERSGMCPGGLPERPKGAVCKTVAKAPVVRIHHPPPPAQTARILRKRGLRAVPVCPAVTGRFPVATDIHGQCTDKSRDKIIPSDLLLVPHRLFDSAAGDLVLADDALGVGAQEDLHAVPGPLGDLGYRDTTRPGPVTSSNVLVGQRACLWGQWVVGSNPPPRPITPGRRMGIQPRSATRCHSWLCISLDLGRPQGTTTGGRPDREMCGDA